MTSLIQLETSTGEIVAAVKSLTDYCRHVEAPVEFAVGNAPQSPVPPEAPSEVHKARRSIMAHIAKLQTLLSEPADFLQRLAVQVCLSSPKMLLDTDAELI